jgi:hypothetical protein
MSDRETTIAVNDVLMKRSGILVPNIGGVEGTRAKRHESGDA